MSALPRKKLPIGIQSFVKDRNNPIAQYEGYYVSVFYSYFAALGFDVRNVIAFEVEQAK